MCIALLLALLIASPLKADPMMVSDLSRPGESTVWRFVTDQVMGGVSSGQTRLTDGALTLTGTVSTKNNGGFIQARRAVTALPADTTALEIEVKGDSQTYYLHLRTRATRLPWQYYQAAFTAPRDWTQVTIPLTAFKASGRLLPRVPAPETIRSVALVAYGRDHQANVSLRRVTAQD